MKLEFCNAYLEAKKELVVSREDADKYRGYLIVEEYEDSKCKIVKPAMVNVVLETDKPQKLTFRIIDKVMDLYPNCDNIEEAFKEFNHDAVKGKLEFGLNDHYALVITRE